MDFCVRAMSIPFGGAYLYLGWVETTMVHEPGLCFSFQLKLLGLEAAGKGDMLMEHVGCPGTHTWFKIVANAKCEITHMSNMPSEYRSELQTLPRSVGRN